MKKFYDKSILFEVVKRSSGDVVDSFAMSIPPGSIRTSLPQRECITDTFDGVFIDDWGIGKQRISISGTTGGKPLHGKACPYLFCRRNGVVHERERRDLRLSGPYY